MFEQLNNYFSEEVRGILKEGVVAWHALKRHEDWNHWLRVGRAIAATQDIAAEVVGNASGIKFSAFMASCYAKPTYLAEFAEINKTTRSFAAKCWREREAIEAWRQKIGDRALQLNHPKNVWQAFEASRRPPREKQPAASPYDETKQKLAEAQAEISRLRKQPQAASKSEKEMERLRLNLKMVAGMLASTRQQFGRVAEERDELAKQVERLSRDGPPWAQYLRKDNTQLRRELLGKLPPGERAATMLEEILELRRQVAAKPAGAGKGPTDREINELLFAFHPDYKNAPGIDLKQQRAIAMLIERRKKSRRARP